MEEFKKIIDEYKNEIHNYNERQTKKVKDYDEIIKLIIEAINFIMLQNHTIIQLLNINKVEENNEKQSKNRL